MNYRFLIPSFSLLLSIGAGCSSPDPEKKPGAEPQPAQKLQGANHVPLINEAELQSVINKRDGKLLLVNVWATWCLPCIEEFPDLVKLHNTYGKTNVEIIAISVDDPDEIQSKVVPFLEKHHVPFKVYVASFRTQEEFINMMNASWSGAIPATFIYNSNRKQQRALYGKKSFDQFREAVGK